MKNSADHDSCLKASLFIYNAVFLLIGIFLIGLTLWFSFDPRRTYVLNFVNVYEDDPLLLYSNSILTGTGWFALLISILGFCATVREIQVLLIAYATTLAFVLLSQVIVVVLSLSYYAKFQGYLSYYLYNITVYRYGREQWITDILDTVQFYHKCCGSNGTLSYYKSYWQITYSKGTLYKVPISCCKQTREAYPPDNLHAIDEWCQFHAYNSSGQLSSVYTEGCYDRLLSWIGENCFIFTSVGVIVAFLQIVGISLALRLCRKIGAYYASVENR